jgi:FtsZ-binding cell division protein ZapB
LLLFL